MVWPVEFWTLAALCGAAALAGCVDAISGGGGLIQVPALFSAFPQAAPAALFATNKAASVWGTSWAALQYLQRVQLRPAVWASGALAAGLGSASGAWAATQVPAAPLRMALPLVLLAVLIYTLARPHLGVDHQPRFRGAAEASRAAALGGLVGGYDGLFGPGTGSFFVFGCVRWLGYDFLHGSACAKLFNAASNLAALAVFGLRGALSWQAVLQMALPLALANVAGSGLGSWLALRRGAGFVRGVFLAVVGVLIAKTALDAWRLLAV